MATYTSSIGGQLARAEAQVKAYLRRMLLLLGRRFRARMVSKWLSGPPGVFKITGRLVRSLRYNLVEVAGGYRLEAYLGGGLAPYARDHEERGRIQFMQTFREEGSKILEEIKVGLQFFERNPVSTGGSVADVEVSARPEVLELAQHIRRKREEAKLKRASKWRSMTKEGREPGELARRRAANRKSKAYRTRRDMKWRSIVEPVTRSGRSKAS